MLALAAHVERREGRAAVPRRLAWYLLCFIFLGRLIVSNLDIVPALLAFVAAAGWFAGRPILGGTLAATGGLVKVFPALAILPVGLRELARPRTSRLRGSVAFACTFALGLALWYLLAGPGLVASVRYHAARGLEIGAVGSGLLMIVGRLTGLPVSPGHGHGCFELHVRLVAGAVITASRYLLLLALGADARAARAVAGAVGDARTAAVHPWPSSPRRRSSRRNT